MCGRVIPQRVGQTGYVTGNWKDGYSAICWTDRLFHGQLDRWDISQVVGQTVIPQAEGQTGYVTGSWTDGLFHGQLDRRVIPQTVGQTGYATGS